MRFPKFAPITTLAAAEQLFRDILGFLKTWRGKEISFTHDGSGTLKLAHDLGWVPSHLVVVMKTANGTVWPVDMANWTPKHLSVQTTSPAPIGYAIWVW